jgi:hypothetical protein
VRRALAVLLVVLVSPAAAADELVRLAGTVPPAAADMTPAGDVPGETLVPHVVVYLGLRDRAGLEAAIAAQHDPRAPGFGRWLDAGEIADRFGPRRAHYERVRRWLREHGLDVAGDSPFRVALTVRGSTAAMEHAFGTRLRRVRAGGRVHRVPRADALVPASLGIRGLLGLDDLGPFRPLVRLADDRLALAPADFARVYDVTPLWDAGLTGRGASIAVIARSNFDLDDVTTFSSRFSARPLRQPTRAFVGADPGILPQVGELTEVLLDTQWSAGLAPEADVRVVIASPDDDIPEALAAAVNAGQSGVISLSFGLCEQLAVGVVTELFDGYYAIANAQGQTVVVAAGDWGHLDCAPVSSAPAVNALASSPHAVAVGGTALEALFDRSGALVGREHEYVWNDAAGSGGGGESLVFARPTFQLGLSSFAGRVLPDLALAASPRTPGYVIVENGVVRVVGGTSAGAPAFSGILALVLQHLEADGLGHVLPRLYALAAAAARGERAPVFDDVVLGTNGFDAAPGFDLASGWGTPRASALRDGLATLPPGVCEPALGCLVPGRGGARKACLAEWLIERRLPDVGRRGLPSTRQSCRDGDPECDADATADGRCTFRVALCTNVFDVRQLGDDGVPLCEAQHLRSVRLRRPRGARDAGRAAAEALDAALATLPMPTSRHAGCTPATPVVVPIEPGERGRLELRARVRRRAHGGGSARLDLRCVP